MSTDRTDELIAQLDATLTRVAVLWSDLAALLRDGAPDQPPETTVAVADVPADGTVDIRCWTHGRWTSWMHVVDAVESPNPADDSRYIQCIRLGHRQCLALPSDRAVQIRPHVAIPAGTARLREARYEAEVGGL